MGIVLRLLYILAAFVLLPSSSEAQLGPDARALADQDHDGRRVALVIGNAAYEHAQRLVNPLNDAEAIAAKLEDLGFAVTRAENLGRSGFLDTLPDFARVARGAELALVYYSGHGVQRRDNIFLMPVDASLDDESDLYRFISLRNVITAASGAAAAVVIGDTSRDDPFSEDVPTASSATPLAEVATGVRRGRALIAFAAGAGRYASEGVPGERSPYAEALLDHMDRPIDIRHLFDAVGADIREQIQDETNGVATSNPVYWDGLGDIEISLAPSVEGGVSSVTAQTSSSAQAASGERVALVIGNAAYEHAQRLNNPLNDADAIAAKLEDLGFAVTRESDLDEDGLEEALKRFNRAAHGAAMAVVYYSGHGLELDGENYLVPTDAELESAWDVSLETVSLEDVENAVSPADTLRLIILDACRDNPFLTAMERPRGLTKSVDKGLGRVEPGRPNTLIAYAARHGTTASDGTGTHSPYAAALLEEIDEPGLEISLLFRRVRDRVLEATGNQMPFTYGSLSGEPIYLNPPEPDPDPPPDDGPSPAARAWAYLEDQLPRTEDTAARCRMLDGFLDDYAGSPEAAFARIRKRGLGCGAAVESSPDDNASDSRLEDPSSRLSRESRADFSPSPDGRWRIQLAASTSMEEAQAEWRHFVDKHPEILGAFEPVYPGVTIEGTVWVKVQAGPVDETSAVRVCERLIAQGTDCLVRASR
ncbi:MAG: caspase family protein [Marinovum algicola]